MTPDLAFAKYRKPVQLTSKVSVCYSDQLMDLVFSIAGPFTADDMTDPQVFIAATFESRLFSRHTAAVGITTLARGVDMGRIVITTPELFTRKAPAAKPRPKTLEGLVPLALRIYLTVTNSSSALTHSKNKLRFLVVGPFNETEMNSRDTLVTLAGERHPQCKPNSTLSFLAATTRHANLAEAVADGTVIIVSLDTYNWRKLERTAAYQVQIEKGEATRRRQRQAAEEWRALNKQIRAELDTTQFGERKGCTLSDATLEIEGSGMPFKIVGDETYIDRGFIAEGTISLSDSSMAKLCAQSMGVDPRLLAPHTGSGLPRSLGIASRLNKYRDGPSDVQPILHPTVVAKERAYLQINEARAVIVGLRGMAPDADLDALAANLNELTTIVFHLK